MKKYRRSDEEFKTHLPKKDDERSSACNVNQSYYQPTKTTKDKAQVTCERCLKLVRIHER